MCAVNNRREAYFVLRCVFWSLSPLWGPQIIKNFIHHTKRGDSFHLNVSEARYLSTSYFATQKNLLRFPCELIIGLTTGFVCRSWSLTGGLAWRRVAALSVARGRGMFGKRDMAGLYCHPVFFQVNYPFSVRAGEAARGQHPHTRAAILH